MEWTDTGEQISKSSHLLQQEIYRRFTSDPETALLFLGFCDRTVPLSASLSFWRAYSGKKGLCCMAARPWAKERR